MTLTTRRCLPATFVFLTLLAWSAPAYAGDNGPPPHRADRRPAGVRERLALYSPRLRRSVITYLRLRLLELREEDLDRARLAVEHRLSIDELLTPPSPSRRSAMESDRPHRAVRPTPAPPVRPETNACPACTSTQR